MIDHLLGILNNSLCFPWASFTSFSSSSDGKPESLFGSTNVTFNFSGIQDTLLKNDILIFIQVDYLINITSTQVK